MRGDMVVGILEALGESAKSAVDIIEVLLSSPYGTSLRGFEYRLREIKRQKSRQSKSIYLQREQVQKFYTMLYYLKRQGLIEEKGSEGMLLGITRAGVAKLRKILKAREENLPVKSYIASASSTWTIVVFDVPEGEKRKRSWLRIALQNMGFKMVQKSVWLGKTKIPRDFLNDIKNLEMAKYVEIFQITKTGSLDHLL